MTDFFKKIKENIAPVYLLYGDEEYVKASALKQLIGTVIADATLNLSSLEGDTPSDEICSQSLAIPFFGSKRMVVVTDSVLLKKSAGEGKNNEEELLLQYLAAPSESTCLVFYCTKQPDKRRKLFKALSKFAVFEFTPLTETELVRWVEKTIKNAGKSISSSTASFLIEYAQPQLEMLINEINKLVSYTGENATIEKEDVISVVTPSREYNIFKITDAISSGNTGAALELLALLLRAHEEPIFILGIISKEFRRLLRIKLMVASGKSKNEIAGHFALKDFIAEKLIRRAASFTEQQLKKMVSLCLKTDEGLKSGLCDDDYALHLLIIELCTVNK